MTSSDNINDHNMAEDISQQTLMVSRCVDSLPPSVILTTETCSLIPKTNSSDILQLALSEVDGYDQNPSQNLQEMEQQLSSDHSYIHSKDNNIVSSIVAPESSDIDYITETEMVETLQPKSISFVSTPVSMTNELFSKNSSLVTNSMTLSEMDVLTSEAVGDNEHQTHSSQMASLSIGEQYLNGSNDPTILPADVVMVNSEIPQLPPFSLEQYSLQNSILTVSGEMTPETSQLQSLCSNGNLINNSNLLITVKPVSLEQRFLEKVNQQQESVVTATETPSEHSLSLEQPESNTVRLTETAPGSAPDVTTLLRSEPQTFVETPAPVTTAPVTNTHIKFLSPPSKQSEKPVGSHENPIKLILHGNAYHPTQRLTKVQLEEILSILKRNSISNVFQNKVQNGCQSVIYDQPTKTRIVCRSLNPKELASSQPSSNGAKPATFNTARRSQCKRRGRPRKFVPRKSGKEESVCAVYEEEREERRGQTTTRSGRICKPPRPYFKDYMHIPVCDMAKEDEPSEEVDEECHGYSSYTGVDEEEEAKPSRPEPGVTTSKHRRYSCPACSKAYIGQQGLAKHFQLNPKHLKKKDDNSNLQDDLSNPSLASSTISNYSEGNANSQSVLSTCSQTITSICQVPVSTNYHQPLSNVIPTISQPINHQVVSTTDHDSSVSSINDHQNRLKEVLKGFSDEELYEALLSRFGQSVSLWDFFVKKCSEKPEGAPLISEMLKEFEKFLPEFQRFSHACLSPASFQDPGRVLINISNKQVADALSLETGDYFASGSNPTTSPPTLLNPFSPPKQKRLEEDTNHLLDLLHLGLNTASSTTVTPSALSTGCLPAVPFDPVARGENGGASSFLEMEGLVGGMEGTGCLTEIVTPVNHPIILDQGALLEGNGEYEVLHQGERYCLLVSNGQSVLHRLSAPPDFHPNIQQSDQVPHSQLPDL